MAHPERRQSACPAVRPRCVHCVSAWPNSLKGVPCAYNSHMPRFVILEHDPLLHWDLMLERDGVLRTWRLAESPGDSTAVAAGVSFDHRLVYLDYEGPISGNRGVVRQWDRGTYLVVVEEVRQLTIRF